ncbi:MAG: AMP-binding protein, partial [Planctomycetota bacterium]|nr:AMP-binding protein [Planctomycetota bacterium]
AATCSGIAVVPVDPQTTYDELARVIPFTETSLVVASAATFRRLRQHASDFKVPVLNLDDNLKPFDGVPVRSAEPKPCTWGEAEPQDTASIIFTSGTTVDPRGVLLTHRNILSDAMAVGKVLRPYPTDRFLSVLPLHHVFEFTGGFLMPLWGGAKITYVEAIKSRVILETMRKTRTSCMLGVPRLFEILHESIHKHVASLSLPARLAFRTNLGLARLWRFVTGRSAGRFLFRRLHKQVGGSIRLFVSGGAALDPEIFDGFALLGFPICEGYGMTETAPVLTVNPLGRAKSGSVGRPLPGVELRIDDPDDQGVGEIVVRGDMLMQGYLRNEDATRSMLRHGWLHTGDLGFLDDDGYLFITGRSKDLIVTASGKNVYPDEVEALYRKALPHVREMCVVGIRSDGGHGEEVHAVVVPDWREWTGERDMGDWRRAVADSVREASRALPTYQRIQKVHYWDEELPKTADLKIQRRVVRDAILAGRTAQTPPAAAETAPVFAQNGALSDEDVDRLLELLSSITKVPRSQTTRSSNLQFDLGMDSLMKVELLAALEEAFQVQIPDSLAAELLTVEDVTLRIADCREAEKKGSRSAYWDRVLTGASPEKFEPEPPRSRLASIGRRSFRWAGYLFYRRYLGLEVEGLDNVPPDGACILVSNHVSHLDSGAVLVALRGRAKGLRLVAARDYFFNTRLRSWFFRNVFNAIPFERRERFIEGLRHCRAALERGERLLIFPEGTRSVTGELQPFKAGIGLLAAHLQVPIIPTRIRGTFDAMPKGSYWPRPGQVHVTFGKPVSVSEPAGDSPYEVYRKVADEVRRRVEELA